MLHVTASTFLLMVHFYFAFRSENAGLIPRSLSLIFHKLQHNQHDTINLHISFLEIYTETAFDLLGPLLFKGPRKFKELPKVQYPCMVCLVIIYHPLCVPFKAPLVL